MQLNFIKYGKILRDYYLYDIYGSIDSFDFFKDYFKNNQEQNKINKKIINIKRNAFS